MALISRAPPSHCTPFAALGFECGVRKAATADALVVRRFSACSPRVCSEPRVRASLTLRLLLLQIPLPLPPLARMLSRIASRSTRRAICEMITRQRPAASAAAMHARHAARPGSSARCSAVSLTQCSSSHSLSFLRWRSFSSSAATDKPAATATDAQTAQATAASSEQQSQSTRSDSSHSSSSKSNHSHRSGNGTRGNNSGSSDSQPPPYPPPSLLVRMLSTLALLPIVYLIHDNVASLSSVRGTSMQPTLNPTAVLGHPEASTADVVLVWKWGRNRYRYRRGEVVVAISPSNPRAQTCKRLIAIEGDWVRHPHEVHAWTTVPRGRVWIEGDNERTSIEDSRQLGPVSV